MKNALRYLPGSAFVPFAVVVDKKCAVMVRVNVKYKINGFDLI